MSAYAEAIAASMVRAGIAEERRRMAERGPLYRVVGTDQVVPVSATQPCRWCPARGVCRECRGSGRLLGNDPYTWPTAVEVVQDRRVDEDAVARAKAEASLRHAWKRAEELAK